MRALSDDDLDYISAAEMALAEIHDAIHALHRIQRQGLAVPPDVAARLAEFTARTQANAQTILCSGCGLRLAVSIDPGLCYTCHTANDEQ